MTEQQTATLDKLRRELVTQSADHLSVAADYRDGKTIRDVAAGRGSTMAGVYAYALAAVLGQVAKDYGEQVGEEFAELVDFMLINGADGENDDVTNLED